MGRAAPGASNPSCKLRGFNGRQLARLSTVFLAFPEEDEQSVGAGRGASLAQPGRPRLLTAGSPPGTRERDQTRNGEALSLGAAARVGWIPRADLGRQGGEEEVGGGHPRRLVTRERWAHWHRPRVLPRAKVNLLLLFVLFLARYWEDFHSCTVTALTDCQEGAKDIWDKLRKESKNLNIQGSLFELCGSGNGAAGSLLPALPVLLASLSAALATWLSF